MDGKRTVVAGVGLVTLGVVLGCTEHRPPPHWSAYLTLTCDDLPELSDSALLSLATAPFDKGQEMDRRKVLGRHRGRCVVADFPCGDVCPMNTTRIVHYVPDELESCTKMGGMVVTRGVPDVAPVDEPFCEPEVVAKYQPPPTNEVDLKRGVTLQP